MIFIVRYASPRPSANPFLFFLHVPQKKKNAGRSVIASLCLARIGEARLETAKMYNASIIFKDCQEDV
jgi:hypothetical protein